MDEKIKEKISKSVKAGWVNETRWPRTRKAIYPWKYNGRKIVVNGEVIKVPRKHLFLDLTL